MTQRLISSLILRIRKFPKSIHKGFGKKGAEAYLKLSQTSKMVLFP